MINLFLPEQYFPSNTVIKTLQKCQIYNFIFPNTTKTEGYLLWVRVWSYGFQNFSHLDTIVLLLNKTKNNSIYFLIQNNVKFWEKDSN